MKKIISLFLCMVTLCLLSVPALAVPPVSNGGEPGVYPAADGSEPITRPGNDEPTENTDFYNVVLTSTESTITVSWACNLENVKEFRVWIANLREKVNDRYFDKKNSVGGNEYTFTGLDESKTYYIMIDAVSADDESIGRSEIFSVSTAICAPLLRRSTEDLIALQYREGYEYRIRGDEWQKSNVFTGLSEHTTYLFEWKNEKGERSGAAEYSTLCSHPATHEEFNEERGYMTRVCDACGEVVSTDLPEHEPHEHVWGEYEVTEEPSCIKEGVTRCFCRICGEMLDERTIAKTAHVYSSEYEDAKGNIIKHCVDCGETVMVKEYAGPSVPTERNVAVSGDITVMIGSGFAFGEDAVLHAANITENPGAEKVLGSNAYNKAVREIIKQLKYNGVSFYQIKVEDPDGGVFTGSPASVKISTARFKGDAFCVYEILPNGSIVDCGAKQSDGYIVFAKRSNGVYAVVDTTGHDNNKNSSKTWLIIVLVITALFLGGAGYAAHYIYSSIRRKKSREWLNDNPDMSDQN